MIARILIPFTAAVAITALLINLPFAESDSIVESPQFRNATPSVFAVGVVEGAREEIELRFQVADRVKFVFVREGDRVKEGQCLAELDERESAIQYDLAVARLSRAKSELAAAQVTNLEEIALWQAKLEATEAQLAFEQATLERLGRMVQRQAVSEQNYDNQVTKTKVMSAEVTALQARIRKLHKPATDEQLRVLEAMVEAAAGEVRLADLRRQRCRLLAPCDGVVTRIDVEPGELIRFEPGVEPAMRLVDDSQFRVCAYIEEPDAHLIKPGMQAEITLRDGSSYVPLTGTVVHLDTQFESKSIVSRRDDERFDVRTRKCWIVVDGSQPDLLVLGAHVDVTFHGKSNDESTDATLGVRSRFSSSEMLAADHNQDASSKPD